MAINIITALKAIGKSIKSLQDKKMSKTQFKNIIGKSYKIMTAEDIQASSNWTIQDSSYIALLGNELIIHVYAKRSSDTGSGNITDQTVCTFTIDDERITYIAKYMPALTYITGITSNALFKCNSTTSPWECSVILTYTHDATSYSRHRFIVPITIDVTKY